MKLDGKLTAFEPSQINCAQPGFEHAVAEVAIAESVRLGVPAVEGSTVVRRGQNGTVIAMGRKAWLFAGNAPRPS